jgi:hypothetical protein
MWKMAHAASSPLNSEPHNMHDLILCAVPPAAQRLVNIGLVIEDPEVREELARLAALQMLLTEPDTLFVVHTGDTCPVPKDAFVFIDLDDGTPPYVEQANHVGWGPGLGPGGLGRVQRYARLSLMQAEALDRLEPLFRQ